MHNYKKSLGQHFIHDSNIIDKIIKYIKPDESDTFLEIGPGDGALSFPLSTIVKNLIMIEKDSSLISKLNLLLKSSKSIKIINGDILKIKIEDYLINDLRVVGNLPYNISTEILFKFTHLDITIRDLHFMLQKEVVDRVVAKPKTKQYGRLSIMCQTYFSVENLFDISPNVFFPKPKVWSSYIRLVPKKNIFMSKTHENKFNFIVNASFISRRKMIKSSLKNLVDLKKLSHVIGDITVRPEELHSEDFIEIARHV